MWRRVQERFNFRLGHAREPVGLERFAYDARSTRSLFVSSFLLVLHNYFIYVGISGHRRKKLLPLARTSRLRSRQLVAAVADILSHEKSVAPTNIFFTMSSLLHSYLVRSAARGSTDRSALVYMGPWKEMWGPPLRASSTRHRR